MDRKELLEALRSAQEQFQKAKGELDDLDTEKSDSKNPFLRIEEIHKNLIKWNRRKGNNLSRWRSRIKGENNV